MRGKSKSRSEMTADEKRRKDGRHHTGTWISKRERLAIYLRDRFTCLYCLRDLHGVDPRDLTLDHLVSRSDGGAVRDPRNLVTACRSCNAAKGDRPLNLSCGPETRSHIRRNCKRSMVRYRTLAAALIAGKAGEKSD